MITIMPPQQRSWGAIPVLLYGQLSGIRARHDVTIVTLAGPDEAEFEAVAQLRRSGLEVHAVERSRTVGMRGWLRRGPMAASWVFSVSPKRTIWYCESRMQSTIDRVLADRRFDLIQVEDLAAGVYRLPSAIPKLLDSSRSAAWASDRLDRMAPSSSCTLGGRRARLAPVAGPPGLGVAPVRSRPGVLSP